jgi:hypothetical protein
MSDKLANFTIITIIPVDLLSRTSDATILRSELMNIPNLDGTICELFELILS